MKTRTQIRLGLFLGILIIGMTTFFDFFDRPNTQAVISFLYTPPQWADSIYVTLNTSNRYSQLILVETESRKSFTQLARKVKETQPGGVIFNQYSLDAQREITGVLQEENEVPLLIGMRSPSFGIGMPTTSVIASIRNKKRMRMLGEMVATHAKKAGAHLLISPSLTCNNFSDTLTQYYLNFLQPLQETKLLCAMDFSCESAPSLQDTSRAFFKHLVNSGVSSLVFKQGRAPRKRQSILNARRTYNGLIIGEIPDSLTGSATSVARLLNWGVEMFIVKDSVQRLAKTLQRISQQSEPLHKKLDKNLRKTLLAKSWAMTPSDSIQGEKPHEKIRFSRMLNQSNATLVKNESNFIPIKDVYKKRMGLYPIGKEVSSFASYIKTYTPLTEETPRYNPDSTLAELNLRRLLRYDCVLLTLREFRLDQDRDSLFLESLRQLSERTKVVILNYGALDNIPILADFPVLLHFYGKEDWVQDIPAQIIMGGIPSEGRLPVAMGNNLPEGLGRSTTQTRLGYELPESVGLSSDTLSQIDSIIAQAIDLNAFPGCQVLVARKGKVIYHKAFGHQTYSGRRPVQLTDLYDIASLTKITATTLAAMYMYENKQLSLNSQLKEYFDDTIIELDSLKPDQIVYTADTLGRTTLSDSSISKNENTGSQDSASVVYTPVSLTLSGTSNIFRVRIKDLLVHHSGLPPSMPIRPYLNYKKKGLQKYGRYFSSLASTKFPIEVANEFYLRKDFRDSIWFALKHLPLFSRQVYEYSDVNMILLQQTLDSINRQPLDEFLSENIYGPLGLQTARFRPRNTLPARRIAPTEFDRGWRGTLLRGYVHDPSAALMGGVAGNAGLFSDALDIATIGQLWLNNGSYGGKTYFSPATVTLFTTTHKGHRGYGFDKPPLTGQYFIGDKASKNSYGHTGFTGTCLWVDPDNELVYVFLSNRVYPSAKNWRINTYRVRQRVHDAVYRAME